MENDGLDRSGGIVECKLLVDGEECGFEVKGDDNAILGKKLDRHFIDAHDTSLIQEVSDPATFFDD